MNYLIQIEDNPQAKNLLNYLKTLKFVKVLESNNVKNITESENNIDLYDFTGKNINIQQFNATIESAEQSNSLPLEEAILQSEQWKNKRK